MKKEIVDAVNKISRFLAFRQLNDLTVDELYKEYNIKKVDILLLLGSDLPKIVEIGCNAYQEGLCDYLLFCGGIGHSTQNLKEKVSAILNVDISHLPETEAELYSYLARIKYSVPENKIIIENKSANTAENIKFAMHILKEREIAGNSFLLLQDPILQRRSYVTAQDYIIENKTLISYAPFIVQINEKENMLPFYPYLWPKDRFYELILGEIWRLRDDEKGYGPRGKGFIRHVDIPQDIEEAYIVIFDFLSQYKDRCS